MVQLPVPRNFAFGRLLLLQLLTARDTETLTVSYRSAQGIGIKIAGMARDLKNRVSYPSVFTQPCSPSLDGIALSIYTIHF